MKRFQVLFGFYSVFAAVAPGQETGMIWLPDFPVTLFDLSNEEKKLFQTFNKSFIGFSNITAKSSFL